MMTRSACPIFALPSLDELPGTLATIHNGLVNQHPVQQPSAVTSQSFISNCVRGVALSESQTNVLTGVCSSLTDLIAKTSTAEGQEEILDYMGDKDGTRVIAFLTQDQRLE
jgi:hypothetical protein